MTVAAKCNIVDLVLQDLAELQYGFACKSDSKAVLENYLEYLDCANIILNICNPASNCEKDNPVSFNCEFNIISISATLHPDDPDNADIIFDLKVLDYVGGKLPFTYNWIFDSNDFESIDAVNLPQVRLKLLPNKVLENLSSLIAVEITDADNCQDIKTCYLTPGGTLNCGDSFLPCSTPVGLQVVYNYVPCSAPLTLNVASEED